MKRINIAIDGYSSCGKSTLAKQLAKELKYVYVDTGAMYRAVTLYFMENELLDEKREEKIEEILKLINISFNYNQVQGDSDTFLNGRNVEDEIRTLKVSRQVSKVSAIKAVRDKLVVFQKKLGKNKGVVMDGRDIGTTVLPNSAVKFFMTADKTIRSKRRYDELVLKGHEEITMEEVHENLEKRDYIDTNRTESPLRQADDAIVFDNSCLSMDEQLNRALEIVSGALKGELFKEN